MTDGVDLRNLSRDRCEIIVKALKFFHNSIKGDKEKEYVLKTIQVIQLHMKRIWGCSK